MYPHERSLVKEYENKPFAIVGVNSDPSLEFLREVMKEEDLTWSSFFDGGGTGGPIATKWGVRGWPTVYIIDHEGIIRYKGRSDLDAIIADLVEKVPESTVSIPSTQTQIAADLVPASSLSMPESKSTMKVHYLEIVTPEVDATCKTLAAIYDTTFSDPVAEFGNARTAQLADGSRVGVRAPMHETETPVTRPYWLVDDIHAAVKRAEDDGAMIAHPPLEIPGQGTFAIYFQGGIQHGLWQN